MERQSIQDFRRNGGFDQAGAREKKKRKHEEFDLQSAFFTILALNEKKYPALKFVYSNQQGAYMSAAVSGREKAAGMKDGVPDITFPFSRHGYSGMYIESKSSTGRTSPAQQKFIAHLASENYFVITSRTVKRHIELTEWYLGIELEKKHGRKAESRFPPSGDRTNQGNRRRTSTTRRKT